MVLRLGQDIGSGFGKASGLEPCASGLGFCSSGLELCASGLGFCSSGLALCASGLSL